MRRSAVDVAIAIILGVWLFLSGAPLLGAVLGFFVAALVLVFFRYIVFTVWVEWDKHKKSKSRSISGR